MWNERIFKLVSILRNHNSKSCEKRSLVSSFNFNQELFSGLEKESDFSKLIQASIQKSLETIAHYNNNFGKNNEERNNIFDLLFESKDDSLF